MGQEEEQEEGWEPVKVTVIWVRGQEQRRSWTEGWAPRRSVRQLEGGPSVGLCYLTDVVPEDGLVLRAPELPLEPGLRLPVVGDFQC